jgi:hypothetical protein
MSTINYNPQIKKPYFKINVIKLACLIWLTIMSILITSYIVVNHYINPVSYNITQISTPPLETDNPIIISAFPNGDHASIHVLSDET